MPRESKVHCVGCGAIIRGRSTPIRLQITHSQKKLLESAKALGFTSSNWDIGNVMEGPMHHRCFIFATRVWKFAFATRALSPRRFPGDPPHPPV